MLWRLKITALVGMEGLPYHTLELEVEDLLSICNLNHLGLDPTLIWIISAWIQLEGGNEQTQVTQEENSSVAGSRTIWPMPTPFAAIALSYRAFIQNDDQKATTA